MTRKIILLGPYNEEELKRSITFKQKDRILHITKEKETYKILVEYDDKT